MNEFILFFKASKMMFRNTQFLILNFSFIILYASCKKPDSIQPIVKDITEAVFASGNVEPVDMVKISANSDGFILDRKIEENDVVKAGEVLFSIDPGEQNSQFSASSQNLEITSLLAGEQSPVIEQLKQQKQTAQFKYSLDSTQLQKIKRLYDLKSVSKMDLDQALLNEESSKNNLIGIKKSLESKTLELKQQLVNARSQNEINAARKGYFSVTSSNNSKVYKVFKKKGEYIRRGDVLAILGHPTQMIIKLNIDEDNIEKINLGQQVLLELNTNNEKTYEAEISKIYSQFDEESQSYIVEATFKQTPSIIFSGTPVQANIVVNKKQKALVIPRNYFNAFENKVWVLNDQNKVDTVRIKIGIKNNEWVEVLEGINESNKLVKQF